jgi:hypothetical protein
MDFRKQCADFFTRSDCALSGRFTLRWAFDIEFCALCLSTKEFGYNYEAHSMCINSYPRLTFLVRQNRYGQNFDFFTSEFICIIFELLGAGSSSSYSFTSFCTTI